MPCNSAVLCLMIRPWEVADSLSQRRPTQSLSVQGAKVTASTLKYHTGVTGTNPPWVDYHGSPFFFMVTGQGQLWYFHCTDEETKVQSHLVSDWRLYFNPCCWEREALLLCWILLEDALGPVFLTASLTHSDGGQVSEMQDELHKGSQLVNCGPKIPKCFSASQVLLSFMSSNLVSLFLPV